LQFESFDAAYTARLRASDAPTLDHFASYFGELIRLKLRSRVESREVAEDLRQEIFARVLTTLRSEGGLHNAERLGAFVNSVCNNVLLEHWRSRGRTDSLEVLEETHPIASDAPDALSRVLSQDEVRAVRRILGKLGDRDRDLLRAVFLEERDKDEVCKEFGIGREYLRVLLHRAKQAFKTVYIGCDAKQAKGRRSNPQPSRGVQSVLLKIKDLPGKTRSGPINQQLK
jgi:RNA polymerase sigma-70 factor (ECF subfamily)